MGDKHLNKVDLVDRCEVRPLDPHVDEFIQLHQSRFDCCESVAVVCSHFTSIVIPVIQL